MSCYEEVVKIGKKLDKMISSKSSDEAVGLDLLKTLKKLPMSLDILTKTRIGITVNNFRKTCKTDEVVTLAKALIKSWKKLLPESGSGQSSMTNSSSSQAPTSAMNRSSSTTSSLKDEDSRDSQQNDCNSQKSDSSHGSESPRPISNLAFKTSSTTDTVRLKCREMLASALKIPGSRVDVDSLGAAIEDAIFQEFKNTEMKYKNRVRSRIANMKDAKNPQFRQHILDGYIPPERVAVMTAEEMASDEMKNLRAKFTKEAIDDHQMSAQAGTKSDLFKCGKCGQRDTMYNQVQTRSSDEPMTTFVLCNHCGNRWKFC